MTYREMRTMLRKIPKVLKEIESLRDMQKTIIDEIDRVEQGINPQGQILSGMPHGKGISMTTENEALKLISLKERYSDRLYQYTSRIMELEDFINRIECALCWVSSEQEKIIRLRYWKEKSMIATALELNRSERSCYVLERQAFVIMGGHL